ncbi:hypothetical protein [Pseudoalteromonas tunicata]|uniref:hypothetical protein n=1 Tax=Pseudoalteromonas tunicata TaxID=314281 RepID=UPI00273DC3D3|nr:hypothetical protein [Pseudoalteromonas tunicata]MDP4985734.1 hypothetical protein [Pseudoalteromonas tunicata]
MSIKIKQQKLLSATELKKQQQAKKLKQSADQIKSDVPKLSQQTSSKSKVALLKLLFLALVTVIGFLSPKPSLIIYEKSGLVAKSIYWPGIFNLEQVILDSNLKVTIDNKEENIFFCHSKSNISGCQKYRIIKKEGVLSALTHLTLD